MTTMAKLTAEEKDEIVELYKSGEPVKDIAECFHLADSSIVCQIARKAGAPPRKIRTGKFSTKLRPICLTPEEELLQLKRREAELREQIEHRQLAVKQVDETTVAIHGVTTHFLKLGGMAKVREFVIKHFPQEGIESVKPCPHCNGRGVI